MLGSLMFIKVRYFLFSMVLWLPRCNDPQIHLGHFPCSINALIQTTVALGISKTLRFRVCHFVQQVWFIVLTPAKHILLYLECFKENTELNNDLSDHNVRTCEGKLAQHSDWFIKLNYLCHISSGLASHYVSVGRYTCKWSSNGLDLEHGTLN